MNTISKLVFAVTAAVLPATALASVEALNFSCTSNLVLNTDSGYQATCEGDFSFDGGVLLDNTSISIAARGLLNIGEHAILTAPDIRLFANDVIVNGSLSALGGIIEINSPNSVELGVTAKLDSRSTSVSVADYPDLYAPKPSLPNAGNITVRSGAVVTNGSFNSSIGLLSGMQGGVIVIESPSFPSVCGGCPAIQLSAISQVPEPSHLSMLALGLLGVSFAARRKTNKH